MSAEPLEGEVIIDETYEVRDNTLCAAGRWRRFAARIIDIFVVQFLVTFFCNVAVGLFAAFILDSVIYAIFKNTFGKWLFGMQVVEMADFQPISGKKYLKRNCWVFVSGFGLGIPLISFFTMLRQFLRLGRGETASYDHGNCWYVVTSNNSCIKTAIGVCLILLFFLSLFIVIFAAIAAIAAAMTAATAG